jgi:hypothetical protein
MTGNERNCEGTPNQVLCLVFDEEISYNTWTDGINNIKIVGGNSEVTTDSDEPVPIFKRGLWFDGVNDFLKVINFSMHHTFTIEQWIRPIVPISFYSVR